MIEYRKLRPEEWADAIDFANLVFSANSVPHDFMRLIPKVYGPNANVERGADASHVAIENGRIKAMVACPVFDARWCDAPVRVGVVGTVSVHPYARGAGHMKKVMANMLADAREKGADILVLGGQHQRYQYFGFDQAGYRLSFTFTEHCIRHSYRDVCAEDVTFAPMENDDSNWDTVYAIYEAQPVCGARPRAEFADIFRNWSAVPYGVFVGGVFSGAISACGYEGIQELLLTDDALLPKVLKAWQAKWKVEHFAISAAPWEKERIEAWLPACEEYTIQREEQIAVLNWKPVLTAALQLRLLCGPVADVSAVLELDGQKLAISVKNGEPSVEETDAPADFTFSGPEAVRKVFAPAMAVVPGISPMPGVFPLPFALAPVDRF